MEPEAVEYAYQPGDVIKDCIEPFAKVLNDKEKGQRCDHCFKSSLTLKRCAGCALMHYCDKSCQAKDWKLAHKFECKSDCFKLEFLTPEKKFIQVSQSSTVHKRPLFRLFAILKLHPELGDKPYKVYSGKTQSFNDLKSHHGKPFAPIVKYCTEMASRLEIEGHRQIYGQGRTISPVESYKPRTISHLIKLAGIWQANALAIQNEDESRNIIGWGLYIEPSSFKHSCRPDILILHQGARAQIRAVAPIPKGVDPHVSYLPVLHELKGHRERCALLRERYQFQCKCPRCTKEGQDGDEVDYEAMNRLILNDDDEAWTSYYKSHGVILKYLRKLYHHEYHDRITNQVFFAFKMAQEVGVPRAELTSLAKDTEDHLRVTYGEGHSEWGLFMRRKRDLGLNY